MGPDGVGNVTDVDGVQVLVVTGLLYEDLLERETAYNAETSARFKREKVHIEATCLTWLLRL